MIGTILLVLAGLLAIGALYVALEVGLYLKWAINREPGQNTDLQTYAEEGKGGLIANYCG